MRKSSAPTAAPVEAVYRLVPRGHRLALLWLDCSGARVSSVDLTTVGDDDEPRRRVRLRAMTTKIRRALWLELPNELAEAVGDPRAARGPRLGARLFADSGADALRTSIAKACKAAGSRCSHRTTCVTAGSRSCTSAVCRGRGSTSWSVSSRSRSPRTPTRTSSPTRRSSITRASGRFGEQRDRVSAIASPTGSPTVAEQVATSRELRVLPGPFAPPAPCGNRIRLWFTGAGPVEWETEAFHGNEPPEARPSSRTRALETS